MELQSGDIATTPRNLLPFASAPHVVAEMQLAADLTSWQTRKPTKIHWCKQLNVSKPFFC